MKTLLFIASMLAASSSFAVSTCIVSWVDGAHNDAGDNLGRVLVSCEANSSSSKNIKTADTQPTYSEIATQLNLLQQNGYKIIFQAGDTYTLVK